MMNAYTIYHIQTNAHILYMYTSFVCLSFICFSRFLLIFSPFLSLSFLFYDTFTAILSGRDLFTYNSALFIDDDAAIDATEENDLNEQTRREKEKEEAEEAMEAARAQAEQERLQQVPFAVAYSVAYPINTRLWAMV